MADSRSGSIHLRGRFPAGTEVRLVRVEGPHVMRPGAQHETVDTQTVDKDGALKFSKGVKVGERYFASGYVNGQPRDVRLTGQADPDEGFLTGYEPVQPDRVRLGAGGSGGFADEEQPRNDAKAVPDGATWLAQDQVPKNTLQRSDTIRGSAHPISADERERAIVQWRKSEPTTTVIQPTSEAEEEEARTAQPPDRSAAKSTTRKGK